MLIIETNISFNYNSTRIKVDHVTVLQFNNDNHESYIVTVAQTTSIEAEPQAYRVVAFNAKKVKREEV